MEERDHIYHRFHRELRRMMCTHHTICDSRVKVLGLHPAQHRLLFHLACKRELTSQKALAEHLGISPAALTVSLGKLEAAGYIKKEVSSADSRVNTPEITEKGRALLEESKEIFDEIDRDMFAGIEEEELNALISAITKMHANLLAIKEGCDAK